MVDVDDVVVALGERYSPVRETSDGSLLVALRDASATPLEIRVEPEWIRLFVWREDAPVDEDALRALLRANEALRYARYGIEDGKVVLRADVPVRLWRADQLARVLAELEHAVSARGQAA